MNAKVEIVKQLVDNYSYIIYEKKNCLGIIVDPSEEEPIIQFLEKNYIKPVAILATHHHTDHISGIKGIKKKFSLQVFSPSKSISGTTNVVTEGQKINFNFVNFEVIATPGHTLDHIVYYSKKDKILLSGDTIFSYGCGRVFEGTNEQMLNSLNKIKNLPDDTMVYCGHEYTYKNLEFVLDEIIYREDKKIVKQKCKEMISKKGSSMPFDLGHQKHWNPFLNCNDIYYRQEISDFHKNKGEIASDASELEFFTYIREKRNGF
ncbi:MAG: Hydroxyacylglutathione hydrolase [Alphaproteobacteria bacterium MarineAlpha5_Bin11]|nr:hydroxyacylglutathione hydrolase [Pelagibacteraceae bacterium]PPR45001.1 MAG: Hydroxyacylglutathione hydrolase [Alphaproteobacteria bacterium MarineAlpha5_Bin11]PPR51407.1 MAG: Hydroxyacylglutathione hydrolase [Alphaproteobacteria bacterium MarineAlpha5_Bin10]|tara:strand:- start:32726 stop:33511 length:786 start_codon:yes stop_codon:yes gene_type:complete